MFPSFYFFPLQLNATWEVIVEWWPRRFVTKGNAQPHFSNIAVDGRSRRTVQAHRNVYILTLSELAASRTRIARNEGIRARNHCIKYYRYNIGGIYRGSTRKRNKRCVCFSRRRRRYPISFQWGDCGWHVHVHSTQSAAAKRWECVFCSFPRFPAISRFRCSKGENTREPFL